ncbi:MAG: DUF86 domain-containing protein [bacterium]|nr:DUF86 domain-containing protein [bacterium]
MFKKDLVQRKISLIQDDLSNLAQLSSFSIEEIAGDFLKQATVERLLERIISRAIDINEHLIAELATANTVPPKDYRETFFRLSDLNIYPKEFAKEIAKSIGTRNLLVHEYDKIDYEKVYASIGDCLKDYHQYVDYIIKFLENR